MLYLFEYHSITTAAYDNRNSITTGQYWLKKVFAVLKDIQDEVVLEGKIYIDEMYFSKKEKDSYVKNGKKLRGISSNKIGVATAITENKASSILIVTNTSKPSLKSTLFAYEKHIKEGATIIHDGEKSHNILVERLKLNSKVYVSTKTKVLKDNDNPMNIINRYHYLAKRFIKAHGGYNRENLQDWMNLFWFITNGPKDKYDKVLLFIEMAILSPKRVKYRDVMSNKCTK